MNAVGRKKMVSAWLISCMLVMGMPQTAALAEQVSEEGTVIWVAPNGSDSNNGGENDPLLTLEGARDAIRALKGGSGLPDGGVTVYLKEGSYERTASFELSEEDSGTADSPIVYRSYPGDTVRLTGGKELPSDGFVPVADANVLERIIDPSARDRVLGIDLAELGIHDYGQMSRHGYWKANDLSLVPPMELYIGGQGMTLARWPNAGTVTMGEITDPGPTVDDPDLHQHGGTFGYTYDRPRFWTEAEDIWLDGIFGYSWEWSYNKVAEIDTENKTITLQYGEMSGIFKNWYPDFHFAQNLLEELDAPGEYYIDRASGMLYLIPNAAFLSGQGDATVTMLKEPMIRTEGASHIRFEELVMEYGRDTAAIILGGSDIVIEHAEIRNFANGGVLINAPGRYQYDGVDHDLSGRGHAVVSSHLQHIGGTAVTLNGGDKTTLEPGNNSVRNSHIHDFAYYHKAYNPAVLFSGVGNQAIGNEIHDAPHPGIILYGNDHLIEYNNIYDICKEFQDLGAIYMNAGMVPEERGTIVRRNYFHHIGEDKHGVEGIYPDNMTMDMTIEENVFYKMGNSAIKSNTGAYIHTSNNIFVDTFVPYDNYEMFMSKEPGNRVDRDYMPAWLDVFERYDNFEGTPYAEKYPELLTFFEEDRYFPTTNTFENNVIYNPTLARSDQTNEHGVRDIHGLLVHENNWLANEDPGFVSLANEDFTLAEDAAVFDRIEGFKAIPFEDIGTQGKIGLSHGPGSIDVAGVYLPGDDMTVSIGQTVSVAAEVVPWNATNGGVSYGSSDTDVATVDADGLLTALSPGVTTVTAVSAFDAAVSDEMLVTVTEGEGIMHFTDFESGGNGWMVDANHPISEDDEGNHWYRILNGANSQHPRLFSDYELEYRLKTPAAIADGATLLMYERNGESGSGYVEYKQSEAGSAWVIYDSQWQTLKKVEVEESDELQPNTVYSIRMIAQDASISVFVDDKLVIQGQNETHSASGKIGFYVEKFDYLEFDDIAFSIVKAPITDIELDHAQLSLETGERRALTALITPFEAAGRKLDWTSSNPDVAVVTDTGTIAAMAPGTAVITAASGDDAGISSSATVTVSGQSYPVALAGGQLKNKDSWTVSDSVYGGDESIRLSGDGVYGYEAETFGDELIRFTAKFGDFGTGWYGFAVRSDRTGDPTWVDANKGYLAVIKANQIEFQSWKPGQTMMQIIPNTAFLPGEEYDIEIGAVQVDEGTRFILKADGKPVLNVLDKDPNNPIAAEGYLNAYHYAGADNAFELTPIAASVPDPEPEWPGTGGPIVGGGGNDGLIVVGDGDMAGGSQSDPVTVVLDSDDGGVLLTSAIVGKLEKPLAVKSGDATLTFPPSLLKGIAEARKAGAEIIIKASPLPDRADEPSSAYRLAGVPYQFELIIREGGTERVYDAEFPETVHVTFSVPADSFDGNEEWLGVYYAAGQGVWEYVGGEFDEASRTLAVELPHFSTYAVMEYEAAFGDVPAGHWAEEAIQALAAKHIVTGKSASLFDPAGATTRAEFAALLARALGLPAAQSKSPFSDVRANDWHADEIAAAFEAGLVTGRSERQFAPDDRISREEMAALLVRAYGYATDGAVGGMNGGADDFLVKEEDGNTAKGVATSLPTDLGQASAWALPYIDEAMRIGLMKGYPDGTFGPSLFTVRAETATAVYNLLSLL